MKTGILDAMDTLQENPGAGVIAAASGAAPCVSAYVLSHGGYVHVSFKEFPAPLTVALLITIAACMGFSLRSVWMWGQQNWEDWLKSSFYVVAIEGTMVFAPPPWLGMMALGCLIIINGVAGVCVLVKQRTPVLDVEIADDPELELKLQQPLLEAPKRRGRPPTRRRDPEVAASAL